MDKFVENKIFNYMKYNLDINVKGINNALKYFNDGNILLATYYAINNNMYELLDIMVDKGEDLNKIKSIILRSDKELTTKDRIDDYIYYAMGYKLHEAIEILEKY